MYGNETDEWNRTNSPGWAACIHGDFVHDKEETSVHCERINHSVNSVETIGKRAKVKN